MAGVDIQAKVRSGLNKAIGATSSATAPLVYLIEMVGGNGTPTNPTVPTESPVLLVDAIFKSTTENIGQSNTGTFSSLIEAGDRLMVSNGDVLISPNDIIENGTTRLIVVDVDVKEPSGVPLAYIALVRQQ